MIISDLEHLEDASEENSVEGGSAFASADAIALAFGDLLAVVVTNTTTAAASSSVFVSNL